LKNSIIGALLSTSIEGGIKSAYGVIDGKIRSLNTEIVAYMQRIYIAISNENGFCYKLLCMHSILQVLKGITLTFKVSHHNAKISAPNLGRLQGHEA